MTFKTESNRRIAFAFATALPCLALTLFGACIVDLDGVDARSCTGSVDCQTGSCVDGYCTLTSGTDANNGTNNAPAATDTLLSSFVEIQPGSFTMGSLEGEDGHGSDEEEHAVEITRGFFLQSTEVTQAQWGTVIGNDPSSFGGCDDCPVETVNWFEAAAFANAVSDLEGRTHCYDLIGCDRAPGEDMECTEVTFAGLDCVGYRLPTEAEWEYAARAGTTGARYGDINDVAWYGDNAGGTTHVAGNKVANGWGLHDSLGNVYEWTHDWYGDYPDGTTRDPTGPDTGQDRVYRGGGWINGARNVRAAYRGSGSPGYRSNNLGFRVGRSHP